MLSCLFQVWFVVMSAVLVVLLATASAAVVCLKRRLRDNKIMLSSVHGSKDHQLGHYNGKNKHLSKTFSVSPELFQVFELERPI